MHKSFFLVLCLSDILIAIAHILIALAHPNSTEKLHRLTGRVNVHYRYTVYVYVFTVYWYACIRTVYTF